MRVVIVPGLKRFTSRVIVIAAAGLLTFALTSGAQDAPNGPMSSMGPVRPDSRASMSREAPRSPSNGVGLSTHNLSINGDQFAPIDSSWGYSYTILNGSYLRFATSLAATFFHASFDLPSGAMLDQVSMEILDNSVTDNISFFVFQCSGTNALGPCVVIGQASSSGASPDGQYITVSSLGTTIDDLNNSYFIEVNAGADPSGNLGWRRASISYHLQLSPPPGAATFNDVPTSSPQFQYVEALAASGITVGCGGGSYCPLSPLTRGQMAVFLSKALGLWWPN